MKKLIAALVFFIGFSAQAGVISIELDDTNVEVGDTTQMTVSGTGFSPFQSLDIQIEFDTNLFTFDAGSVGGDLFDALPILFSVTEQAYGVAISFLDFFDFTAPDFVVATFDLLAIADGTTDFELVKADAGDFFGPVDAVADDTSVIAKVSAPATISLFAIAGLALFGFRRKA